MINAGAARQDSGATIVVQVGDKEQRFGADEMVP